MSMQDQVNAAAEKLASMGQPVTNMAVRKEIGSGSMTTIAPLLRQWKNGHQPTVIEESDVPGFVMDAARQVYETIKTEMEAEVRRIRAEAKAAIEAAETERDEALLYVDELETRTKQAEDLYELAKREGVKAEMTIMKAEEYRNIIATLQNTINKLTKANEDENQDTDHPHYPFIKNGQPVTNARSRIKMIKDFKQEECEAGKTLAAGQKTVLDELDKKQIELNS
ncbi:MAG: DNA-binding protein [Oceanobacter sp.]